MTLFRDKAMRGVSLILIALQVFVSGVGITRSETLRVTTQPSPPLANTSVTPRSGTYVDRRLALVIGNNDYERVLTLPNPINDARLVARTLEDLGFEVILHENLNLRDFKAVMRQFASRMEREEGSALFYYAGHGMQIEGRNFLLPVDVWLGDEYQIRDESVDLEDTLISRLPRARKREKLIILDACRNNPFRSQSQQSRALLGRGFAQMNSEKDSVVVYSTSPGKVAEDGPGSNSVFAENFVREIQKGGVEIQQALKAVFSAVYRTSKGTQTPWINSSLLGEYYFRPIDIKLEEERRRKHVQDQVEMVLKNARVEFERDEAMHIQVVLAERERVQREREREYNAQIAQFKTLLERRERELEEARTQVAMATRSRDEKLALLASAEAERQQLSSTPPIAPDSNSRVTLPVRGLESDEVRKQADTEQDVRELREPEVKPAAETDRRQSAATAQREQEERDRLLQVEERRKAVERDELARVEAAAQRLQREREIAGNAARGEAARFADEKIKRAKEEAERQVKEAETMDRLATIQADVGRKALLELEMISRKGSLPPELASLMTSEPQKIMAVSGTSGDVLVRGVRLPADVAIKPPALNVPTNCAAFLGAWGNGRWDGLRTVEIWVEDADPDCRAHVVYALGGYSLKGDPANYQRRTGQISGNRLILQLESGARVELTHEGERAAARYSGGRSCIGAS